MTNQKKTSSNYSAEMRERAVRMVFDNAKDYPSQSAAIKSIAAKFGCGRSSLSRWVRQAESGQGVKPPPTSEERERIKDLEREVLSNSAWSCICADRLLWRSYIRQRLAENPAFFAGFFPCRCNNELCFSNFSCRRVNIISGFNFRHEFEREMIEVLTKGV